MHASILILIIFVLLGCKENQTPAKLEGIWIPETIDWNDGSFKFLRMHDTSFIQISATQSKDDKDSIYFMVDPGLNFSAGRIDANNNNAAIIHFRDLYKHVPLISEKFPSEVKIDTIYIDTKKRDFIMYQSKPYRKTEMFKKESIDQMNSISKYYLDRLKSNNN
jgi:hypothetical protein